ncbi:MAG: hypothetical protein KAR79_05135 [Simkaniaceae bacterium]|nr:hypothetical protein [Simkaniaceae bacterium]
MKYIKLIVNILLLLTTPTIIAHPCAPFYPTSIESEVNVRDISSEIPNLSTWTYDEILDWIDQLESGELDDVYEDKDIPLIQAFIADLARAGILPNDTDEESALELDIEEMFNEDDSPEEIAYSYDMGTDYLYSPTIFYGDMELMLCTAWYKQPFKNTKKFIKKHKTAVMIGTAVVVAAAVVICVVAASPAVVAGAAGAASSIDRDKKSPAKEKQLPPQLHSQEVTTTIPTEEAPKLQMILDESCESFKDMIIEDHLIATNFIETDGTRSVRETFRDMGAYLAHETFDAVADLVAILPQIATEAKEIQENWLPDSLKTKPDQLNTSQHPMEVYEDLQATCHEKIDQAFDTNQAHRYTPEAKEVQRSWDEKVGKQTAILPPPGTIGEKNPLTKLRNFHREIPIGKDSPIRSYKELQKLTKGKKGEIQAHHILEQRHLRAWRYPKEDLAKAPAQILSREEHASLTNKLLKALPQNELHSKKKVLETYKEVYKNYPGYLESIEHYFQ